MSGIAGFLPSLRRPSIGSSRRRCPMWPTTRARSGCASALSAPTRRSRPRLPTTATDLTSSSAARASASSACASAPRSPADTWTCRPRPRARWCAPRFRSARSAQARSPAETPLLHEVVVERVTHQLGPRGDSELALDRGAMCLDGSDAEEELLRDLRVRVPEGDQAQDLGLALAEIARSAERLGRGGGEPCPELGVQVRATLGGGAHRGHQ